MRKVRQADGGRMGRIPEKRRRSECTKFIVGVSECVGEGRKREMVLRMASR